MNSSLKCNMILIGNRFEQYNSFEQGFQVRIFVNENNKLSEWCKKYL